MKKIVCLITGFICILNLLTASNMNENTYSLEVVVSGFESIEGQLCIALYNSEESWIVDELVYRNAVVEVTHTTVTHTFSELSAPGFYAVAIFHDENRNEKMDTGLFGMPLENYAFSNNKKPLFRPPAFEDAAVFVNGNETIEIFCK